VQNEKETNLPIYLIEILVVGVPGTLGRIFFSLLKFLSMTVTDLGLKYEKHLLRNKCVNVSQFNFCMIISGKPVLSRIFMKFGMDVMPLQTFPN
jgi:hypothetical protein